MSGNKARHTTPQTKIRSPCVVFTKCSSRASASRFSSFADLVVIAKEFYPIPFRTRPSKPSASMVLRLKPRESRTLPGLPRTEKQENPPTQFNESPAGEIRRGFFVCALRARGGKAPGGFRFCAFPRRADLRAGRRVNHLASCGGIAIVPNPCQRPFRVWGGLHDGESHDCVSVSIGFFFGSSGFRSRCHTATRGSAACARSAAGGGKRTDHRCCQIRAGGYHAT